MASLVYVATRRFCYSHVPPISNILIPAQVQTLYRKACGPSNSNSMGLIIAGALPCMSAELILVLSAHPHYFLSPDLCPLFQTGFLWLAHTRSESSQ